MRNELQVAVSEVLKLSAVDPGFRQLAVDDGLAALRKAGNFQLPDRLNVNFVDNYKKSTITVALPDPIRAVDLPNEEDWGGCLGTCFITCFQTCIGTAA